MNLRKGNRDFLLEQFEVWLDYIDVQIRNKDFERYERLKELSYCYLCELKLEHIKCEIVNNQSDVEKELKEL